MENESLHREQQQYFIDMSLNIWFLRLFGLMELNTTAAWKLILHRMFSAMFVASHIIIMIVNVAGMVRDWGDFDATINNIILSVGVLSGFVRSTYFLYYRQEIVQLLKNLREFENYQWPPCVYAECSNIITKTNYDVRIMTRAVTFFIFLIFLSWTVSPVATAWISGVDPTGWRPHPFLAAFFFDYQSSPNYELVYCFQVVLLFFFCMGASSFDAVCVAFFMQVAGQFRILQTSLRRLQEVAEESLACSVPYSEAEDGNAVGPSSSIPDGSTDCRQEALKKHALQHLKYSIKHHNDIIMFVKKLDDVLNPIMLAELLYSMSEIAISGLQATESSADFGNLLKFLVFAVSLSLELYFFCQYADVLLDLSQDIAITAYSSEWYKMDPQIKTMLQIVIMRAQKPVKVTAFHFKVMSMDTYGALLNGAYSYFALLKEIKKGK